MESVEQYLPNTPRFYKCQKYSHHEDICRELEIYRKCGQENPENHINECDFPNKYTSYGGDDPVYARSFDSWKLEKEI